MNNFAPTHFQRVAMAVLIAAATFSTACTGGDLGGGVGTTPNLGRSVRLAYRLHQPTPEGYLQEIDPERRAREEAVGTRFLDDEMVSGPIPATGHYLRIGDKMIQGGPDGVFQIPTGLAIPGNVELYSQLSDTQPLARVSIAAALRPATEPVGTVDVRVDCKPFPDSDGMDFGSETNRTARPKSCCTRSDTRQVFDCDRRIYSASDLATNDPVVSACDDFSDKSIGRAGAKTKCIVQRFAEFVDTQCYQWTFGTNGKSTACMNERAVLDIDGTGCFNNHKYRFCQNMSPTDFNAVPVGTTTIPVGGSVKIKVRNNTAANETQVEQSKQTDGVLVGAVSAGQIKHYDDPSKTHLNAVECEWLAPSALPEGVAEATETLTFRANGLTRIVTIKVIQNCQDARGRQVPCK